MLQAEGGLWEGFPVGEELGAAEDVGGAGVPGTVQTAGSAPSPKELEGRRLGSECRAGIGFCFTDQVC